MCPISGKLKHGEQAGGQRVLLIKITKMSVKLLRKKRSQRLGV